MPIGETLALLAALCWSIGLTLFRVPLRDRGADQVNFFKCSLGTVLFCVAAWAIAPADPLRGFTSEQMAIMAISGIVGMSLADSFLFMAIARIGGTRAIMLHATNPIFTVALAWISLREELDPLVLAGIVAAVVGTVLVVADRVGGREQHLRGRRSAGVLTGILAALGQAAGLLLMRRVFVEIDDQLQEDVTLYLPVCAIRLAAGALGLLAWSLYRYPREVLPMLISGRAWRQMALPTLVGTFLGILFMVSSLSFASTGVVAALTSMTPIFLMGIGLLVLKERYGPRSYLGVLIGVGGVVLLVWS